MIGRGAARIPSHSSTRNEAQQVQVPTHEGQSRIRDGIEVTSEAMPRPLLPEGGLDDGEAPQILWAATLTTRRGSDYPGGEVLGAYPLTAQGSTRMTSV